MDFTSAPDYKNSSPGDAQFPLDFNLEIFQVSIVKIEAPDPDKTCRGRTPTLGDVSNRPSLDKCEFYPPW